MKAQKNTTYTIVCHTDTYRASILTGFDKHTGNKTLYRGLPLSEAYRLLKLELTKQLMRGVVNWGAACRIKEDALTVMPTFADGTRCFSFDGYTYSVEMDSNNL